MTAKAATVTPEAFAEQLGAAFGSALRSVVLYGSAVTGDHIVEVSDYNLLVVLDSLTAPDLARLAPLVRNWVAAGNPPPLLFTPTSLQRSTDVFAIELADLRDSRRVLTGVDLVAPLRVDPQHLRHELEYELHGKLLQLRSRYLLTAGQSDATRRLLIESLSTFLILARGSLRLFQSTVPSAKLEALRALARHVPLSTEPFETIARWKSGQGGGDADAVFSAYAQAIETLVGAVDARLHPTR